MEPIHILSPYFSAGKKYGWKGNPVGLGINIKLLEGSGEICVRVGDSKDIWKMEKSKALEFIKKYNSFYKARTVMLGVISWGMFTKVVKEERNTIKLL